MYFWIRGTPPVQESIVKTTLSAIAAAVILFPALDTFACVDSYYRAGTNVSYRVYTAPLPGSVLVYGQTDGARQLAEALARSGHGVQLVDNETDLAQEMGKGGYDVVIASYDDHLVVEANSKDSGIEFIPVAASEEEESVAKQSYERVLMADQAEIKHYLKAIHKALKAKA